MPNRVKIFCYIVVLLFFSSSPLFAQAAYEVEPFDGVITNPGWYTDNFGPLQWPTDGLGNQSVRLEACASPSASSLCTSSTSSNGQESAVSTNHNVHAGYVCGSGTNPSSTCAANGNGVGKQEETWYRFHVRLAPGFQATPGTQNSIFEVHIDQRTEADAAAHGGVTAYSTMVDIQADGTSCSGKPAWCATPGTNPRLFLQVPGGPTSCGTACQKRFFPFPKNSLLVDHWYDMVLHMVWSPTVGYVQWWVDGQKMVDVATPTEYVRSDGTWSYGDSLGLYNYRHWAAWASSVDGEQFIWGPTASSINFNPGNPPSVTPSAPTSLSGTDNVSASTTITWAASAAGGVSGYNVYRSTTSGTGYANVGTTSALSFTDHTVKVGTTYFYVVTAVANGVESPSSSEIQVVVAQ
jgi:Polysaccharide lyase